MTHQRGEIIIRDGLIHQVIGLNESGKLVTVVRQNGDIDIYQDGELTDRDTPPPHPRRITQARQCEGCGRMITRQCSVCYKRRWLRESVRV